MAVEEAGEAVEKAVLELVACGTVWGQYGQRSSWWPAVQSGAVRTALKLVATVRLAAVWTALNLVACHAELAVQVAVQLPQ